MAAAQAPFYQGLAKVIIDTLGLATFAAWVPVEDNQLVVSRFDQGSAPSTFLGLNYYRKISLTHSGDNRVSNAFQLKQNIDAYSIDHAERRLMSILGENPSTSHNKAINPPSVFSKILAKALLRNNDGTLKQDMFKLGLLAANNNSKYLLDTNRQCPVYVHILARMHHNMIRLYSNLVFTTLPLPASTQHDIQELGKTGVRAQEIVRKATENIKEALRDIMPTLQVDEEDVNVLLGEHQIEADQLNRIVAAVQQEAAQLHSVQHRAQVVHTNLELTNENVISNTLEMSAFNDIGVNISKDSEATNFLEALEIGAKTSDGEEPVKREELVRNLATALIEKIQDNFSSAAASAESKKASSDAGNQFKLDKIEEICSKIAAAFVDAAERVRVIPNKSEKPLDIIPRMQFLKQKLQVQLRF